MISVMSLVDIEIKSISSCVCSGSLCERICPFHLYFLSCWHKDGHNILSLSLFLLLSVFLIWEI